MGKVGGCRTGGAQGASQQNPVIIQTRSGFKQLCVTSTLLSSVAANMRWRLLNEIVCRADAVRLDQELAIAN